MVCRASLVALAAIGLDNPQTQSAILSAARSSDAQLRACAVRIVCEHPSSEFAKTFWSSIDYKDPSPQVRAELAISLSGCRPSPEAADVRAARWTQLAEQYRSGDRWQLEALGIGADGNWESCLNQLRRSAVWDIYSPSIRDLIWRSQSKQTPELLAEIIAQDDVDVTGCLRYFRAFDFQGADDCQTGVAPAILFHDVFR